MFIDMEIDRTESETLRLQLEKSIERYGAITSLLMQGVGFLVAADVVLLSYGITARKSSALLVAAFMPVTILILRIGFGRSSLAPAYVALQLEDKLCPNIDTLTRTWLISQFTGVYHFLRQVLDEADEGDRMTMLRKGVPLRHSLAGFEWAFIATAIAVQIGISALGLVFLPFA
jgi:hypothetical protein